MGNRTTDERELARRRGSDRLWDDNLAYGCKDCGAFWCF